MRIFVNRPSVNFTMVPNEVIDDERLSSDALSVLVYMMSQKDGAEVFVGNIQKRFRFGRHKWLRISKELRAVGAITPIRGGSDSGTKYAVQWPEPETENVRKSDRPSENPTVGKSDPPPSENPTLPRSKTRPLLKTTDLNYPPDVVDAVNRYYDKRTKWAEMREIEEWLAENVGLEDARKLVNGGNPFAAKRKHARQRTQTLQQAAGRYFRG